MSNSYQLQREAAMTGPDHSKKSKNVTIDLAASDVIETPAAAAVDIMGDVQHELPEVADEVARETVAAPVSTPVRANNGFLGKVGAGLLGGLIALGGGAGLQYTGQLPSFGNSAEIQALKDEVVKLASAPKFDSTAVDVLAKSQADLNAQVSLVADDLASLKATPSGSDPQALAALQDKIAALENALATLPAGSAPSDIALAPAFKALSDKVAALETKPAAPSDTGAVAVAIAASGLKAAIDRGGSFMSELETYASVAPASPDVEALKSLAAKGVPSQQDLMAEFGGAANAMVAAAVVPNPDIGILERLTESAKGLVKSRRVGEITGDEPDAIVARMEVALQRGDLAGLLSEATKLPDASKTAGKPFLDLVTARLDADTLVTRTLGQALSAAGGKS